jgi:N-acyl homoserine lactone hydrolase
VGFAVLPLGACACPYETALPGLEVSRSLRLPVSAYLIRLDDGKNVLVDTGMSRQHIRDPSPTWRGTESELCLDLLRPLMTADDDIEARLASLGVRLRDIDYVINTHLHFDHAGNNALFPHAIFFVQREQYEFAFGHPFYPNQYWNLSSLRYELLDGDSELFDGVEVISTPGHVPGHQSVIVRSETERYVVCGDALYAPDNFDLDNWDCQDDPATARASAYLLKDIAEGEGAVLVYGHSDAANWSQRGMKRCGEQVHSDQGRPHPDRRSAGRAPDR